eukprot:3429755-Amphidinium_carterae.3
MDHTTKTKSRNIRQQRKRQRMQRKVQTSTNATVIRTITQRQNQEARTKARQYNVTFCETYGHTSPSCCWKRATYNIDQQISVTSLPNDNINSSCYKQRKCHRQQRVQRHSTILVNAGQDTWDNQFNCTTLTQHRY